MRNFDVIGFVWDYYQPTLEILWSSPDPQAMDCRDSRLALRLYKTFSQVDLSSEEKGAEWDWRGREEIKKGKIVKKLTIRAKIPWDKLSSIITGVIRPLKDKGLPPEITIEVEAKTEDEFDRTTLDTKVKETLQQIKAKIEEWKEE